MSRTTRNAPFARTARLCLAASLAVASSVSPLPAQERVTLRLAARAGESATYRYEQRIDLRMPPEFGGEQRVASRLSVEQRAEEITETSIRYLAQVREVSVEMESSPTAGDLDFSRFEGQRFRMTVDRRGRLQSLTPLDDAGPGVDQLQQSMRQVGFPSLPPGPVRVGQSWVDTTQIDAAAMALPAEGEIISVSRTTLERLVGTGRDRVAELRVETDFHFEPGGATIPGMRVDLTGSRSDHVRFDVARGRFLGSTGTQEFEMTMSIPGAASSLSIEGTATSRAELLPNS